MAEGNVNDEVMMGYEEGLEALLPSLVLNEATIIPPTIAEKATGCRSDSNYCRHGSSHPLSSPQHRRKNEKLDGNFAWGHGHGTRAVFMDSHGSRRSCAGTGVFLPKIVTTTTIQPVKIKPGMNREWKNNGGGNKFGKSSNHQEGGKETTNQGCINLWASSSPDTFLPKEWTY